MEIPYPKFRYYVMFLYYKLRIFIDCSSGRRRLYLAELVHVINAVFHANFQMPWSNKIHEIETIFGRFKFIGDNYGYSIMSPAFERPDIELFIQNLKQSLKKGKRILFLDIGANVGLYSVGITRFIRHKNFSIIAIEPDPVYFRLLVDNLKANSVPGIRVFNIALGNKNQRIRVPGFAMKGEAVLKKEVTIEQKQLDSILPAEFYKKFDEIFVKMDIEGHEEEAFDGAKNLRKSEKKVRLMIEDCVNPTIITYLKRHAFRFIAKITPYDSFWKLN